MIVLNRASFYVCVCVTRLVTLIETFISLNSTSILFETLLDPIQQHAGNSNINADVVFVATNTSGVKWFLMRCMSIPASI